MTKLESKHLSFTSVYFEQMLIELQSTFMRKHNLAHLPKSMQLYGYGNYDPEKPNLRSDLELIGSDFVNGKYLYDKARSYYKGSPVIKINQYYLTIVLLYLGYGNVEAFLDHVELDEKSRNKQLSLISNDSEDKIYYYLNYYFGEDGIIQKGKTIISNNWKKIKNIYRYTEKDGAYSEFYDFGNIIKRGDNIFIRNKMLLNGKLVEGTSEIFYIGQNDPSHLLFLVGAYCTFDIYNNTVAGRCILEKCESEEEMEERSSNDEIPAYIAMEIRNQRIVNKSEVPKHYLELSKDSPYGSIYESIVGCYTMIFTIQDGRTEKLNFKILPNTYKLLPLDDNVYFERDRLELLNKGSVLYFSFDLTGIIGFDCLDIYFKTYFLKDMYNSHEGVYSGIDNENRLVSGLVEMKFIEL